MTDRIKRLKEVLEFENPWVRVYFDHVRAPDPSVQKYTRIVESDGRPGVAVIPVLRQRVGLVQVFRYPISNTVWEIPRGFGDTADPSVNAHREISEETTLELSGYDLVPLGSIHANSGLLANEVILYAAVCTRMFPDGKPRDPEVIQFKWFDLNSLTNMMRGGELSDSFTYAALLRAIQEGILCEEREIVGTGAVSSVLDSKATSHR